MKTNMKKPHAKFLLGASPLCGDRAIRSNSSARLRRACGISASIPCAFCAAPPFVFFPYRAVIGGHAVLYHPVNTLTSSRAFLGVPRSIKMLTFFREWSFAEQNSENKNAKRFYSPTPGLSLHGAGPS
jgi:hypothetical protein